MALSPSAEEDPMQAWVERNRVKMRMGAMGVQFIFIEALS
jgi:hypothetical protein